MRTALLRRGRSCRQLDSFNVSIVCKKVVIVMAMFHYSISIIGRSGGRSAVAASAYISAERILNEENGIVSDYTHKSEVVYKNILLPDNAPDRFKDRPTLWNEVQRAEQKCDAQLSRSIIVALPKELSLEQQIECLENYIKENFVSKGMIADYAIHDKEGNPHAHIMLTMRGLDLDGNWIAKTKTTPVRLEAESETKLLIPKAFSENPTVYEVALKSFYENEDLDVDIKLIHDSVLDKDIISLKLNQEYESVIKVPEIDPATNLQKTIQREGKGIEHRWYRISAPTNDWNDKSNAETWRASWAEHCNKYLPPELHIDHRSYKRQGLDIEPTIHEGYAARDMEMNGKVSERCQMNREIQERNSIKQQLKIYGTEIINRVKELVDNAKTYFRRNNHNLEYTTGDGISYGETAERDRLPTRRIRRTDELKRAVESTEQFIKKADSGIDVLKKQIQIKEQEIYERLSRLKHRRSSLNNGTTTDRDRESGIDYQREEQSNSQASAEISRLIGNIEAEILDREVEQREQTAKLSDSELNRQTRESEQRRLDAERIRTEAEKPKPKRSFSPDLSL